MINLFKEVIDKMPGLVFDKNSKDSNVADFNDIQDAKNRIMHLYINYLEGRRNLSEEQKQKLIEDIYNIINTIKGSYGKQRKQSR